MRPRLGAAARGAARGRRPRLAWGAGRSGGRRGGPAASAARELLRQDLGRLRPSLRVLRHPADQGRLRAGRGRRGAARPRARRWPPARASSCSSARTRRAGRSRAGAGSSGCSAELEALEPAPVWLRLLYLQPDGVDDALLEALAAHAVPYVDVPLQHASGAVLRRMGRDGDGDAYLDLLARVRAALPGAAVRSTFIAGFPGETEDDVDELLAFVRDAGLARPACSPSTRRKARAAATMPGQVPPELAFERAARLGEAIDEVASAYLGRARRADRRRAHRARHATRGRRRGRQVRAAGAGRRRPRAAQRPAPRGAAARARRRDRAASGMIWRPYAGGPDS